jgi:hypothetical protein
VSVFEETPLGVCPACGQPTDRDVHDGCMRVLADATFVEAPRELGGVA